MAIDTAQKRTSVMGMGAPAGAILSYPVDSLDIISRFSLLNIGFIELLAELVSTGVDIESTFEITRLITNTFNINRYITSSFNIDKTVTNTFEVT